MDFRIHICYQDLDTGLSPFLTHYQMTNFRLSKLKQSADDNFELDENTRKYSKRVENTVGKGEIARYEQFLLFPLCFQKACFPGGGSKGVIVWEWVKLTTCTCTFIILNHQPQYRRILCQSNSKKDKSIVHLSEI